MSSHRRLYRALSDGAGVLVSTLVTCMLGAVVHPALGLALFVAGLVVSAALLAGRGEELAVRLLARARRPQAYELAALRPAIAVLQEHDLASEIRLLVRDGTGIRVGGAGRRTVLVSQGLIEAAASRRVRPDEVAALLAHALGRVRLGQTKYDAALEFWLLPWRVLQSFARGVGRAVGWFPLTGLAWRLRFVMGLVAMVQGFAEGRGLFGVIGTVVVAASYVVPWSARQAELSSEDEADAFVADAGLGDALSRFLERGRRTPGVLLRVHRLRAATVHEPQRPVLMS
ncbi:hypothetical protein [Branchiibius hedensis]|nr:hypothetical protein [Branchiibius hedensis]